jgi:hypothetical protein
MGITLDNFWRITIFEIRRVPSARRSAQKSKNVKETP